MTSLRRELREAHTRLQRAMEAVEHCRRAINTAHSKHIAAVSAMGKKQLQLDEALRTNNGERLRHLLDPEETVLPPLPELQQELANHAQVVNTCAADVAILEEELQRRERHVSLEASNVRMAVGHLLIPTATKMIEKLNALRTEAETLTAALLEFPTSAFNDPDWNASREYLGDTATAHRWRDVVAGLVTNPESALEP